MTGETGDEPTGETVSEHTDDTRSDQTVTGHTDDRRGETAVDRADDRRRRETAEYVTRGGLAVGGLALQAGGGLGPNTRASVAAVNVVLAVVGLVVAYHALRAYGRDGERSMLLFGGGLFLLTTGRAVLTLTVLTLQSVFGLVSPLLGGLDLGLGVPLGVVISAVAELLDVVGLIAVFYALFE